MTNSEKLNDRKWVWVPCQNDLYKPGYILEESQSHVSVKSNLIESFRLDQVARMNPPKFDMVSDLALLSHLNEPSVLHNLKRRYEEGLIYTYSGLFLLSLNPYRRLGIYTEEAKREITLKTFREAEPHIFAVANEAYRQLLSNGGNQSILITGESGAGKTENTKRVIEFLAGQGHIEQLLQAANPVLEAFGNAKTVRNDNSSRFGKFIQLKFRGGVVQGARIEKYLLEKSRVTHRGPGERSFHIFYYLLRGGDAHILKSLDLTGNPSDYLCLSEHKVSEDDKTEFTKVKFDNINGIDSKVKFDNINGVDDKAEFTRLGTCFDQLGIKDTMKYYRIIAAILHLGNIRFTSTASKAADDKIHIVDNRPVESACSLLNISLNDFLKEILHPTINAGSETVVHSRSVNDAYKIVEGLMKMLYNALFDNLVSEINSVLDTSASDFFIGVLDIAGFEIFQKNSFEQLCINYTNEKLQQFFNHHMFILEQQIYRNECIEWSFIDFGLDLEPTIRLIESNNPIGILSYLDEECIMPGASDMTLLHKVRGIKGVERTVLSDTFKIRHYAGTVEYEVGGWLDKNKDVHSENLQRLVRGSKSVLVMNETSLKKGVFRTVSQSHRENLKRLMDLLRGTSPHFVRCIIPNLNKSDTEFNKRLVLDQLRCNGVLEGIRIARLGYPSRIAFEEFNRRYLVLGDESPNQEGGLIPRDLAISLLNAMRINKADYRVGNTMVFMRQGVLADIEDMREKCISALARAVTGMLLHKIELRRSTVDEERRKAVGILQRNARMSYELLKWRWWSLFIKIKPLLEIQKNGETLREKDEQIKAYVEMIDREREERRRMESEAAAVNNALEEVKKENELCRVALEEKESLLDGLRREKGDLASELKDAEILKEKIRQCEIKEENHGRAMEELRSELSLKEALVQSLNQKGGDLSSTLKLMEDEARETLRVRMELERGIKGLNEQLGSATVRNQGLQEKVANQENKLKSHECIIQKLRQELDDVQLDNENLKGDLRKKELLVQEEVRSASALRQDLEYFKKRAASLEAAVNLLENSTTELEMRLEEASSSRNSTEETVAALHKQIKTLSIKLAKLEEINTELSREKDEMFDENQKLVKEKIEALSLLDCKEKQEKKALQLEIQKLRMENEKLRVDLANGSSSHDEGLESVLDKTNQQLESEKTARRQGERRINELETEVAVLENRIRELALELKETEESSLRVIAEYTSEYVPKTELQKIRQSLSLSRIECLLQLRYVRLQLIILNSLTLLTQCYRINLTLKHTVLLH